MSRPAVVVRPLGTTDDYLACVALQRVTWGEDFEELVPPTMLWLTQEMGGIAAGAFDPDDRLIGFVFGLTGVRRGRVAHWSDMLAVDPAWRDRGIGLLLKRWQRDALLAAGHTTLVHWTFDPLEARNAHLNFVRLGVTASEYVRDRYLATSPLHAGLPTDRLIVDWDLPSARVAQRLDASSRSAAVPAERTMPPFDAPLVNATAAATAALRCLPPRLDVDAPAVRIAIPPDIQSIKRSAPDLAMEWRMHTRTAFEFYLARGYTVVDVVREEARSCFLLQQ